MSTPSDRVDDMVERLKTARRVDLPREPMTADEIDAYVAWKAACVTLQAAHQAIQAAQRVEVEARVRLGNLIAPPIERP